MYKKVISLTGLTLLICAVFFSACKKNSDIGLDLVRPEYLIDLDVDTILVKAYTIPIDSTVVFYGQSYYKGIVGYLVDTVFGETNSSFLAQISPNGSFPKEENTVFVFDSVNMFLNMDYKAMKSFSGGSDEVKMQIYKLSWYLPSDDVYYNNFEPRYNSDAIADTVIFVPNDLKTDTIIVGTDTLTNTVVIKLDPAIGADIFNNISSYLGGFYFKPISSPSKSPISVFDLYNDTSKVRLYYHAQGNESVRFFDFNFKNEVNFNMFSHDYSETNFSYLYDENPPQDDVVYIQGLGGTQVKIELDLENLMNEAPCILTRAEFVIETDDISLLDYYSAPDQLFLYQVGDNGSIEFIKDLSVYSNGAVSDYGGAGNSNGRYIFDLTYMVQKIINGEEPNRDLILMIQDGATNLSSVVLASGLESDKKMRIEISISKL